MKNYWKERLARICWNDYGWIHPSGSYGKAKQKPVEDDSASHEARYGYGHEEWLLDFDKLISGYHYAFLEPINKFYSTYKGNTYNISLFAFEGEEKSFYWIGKLNNVKVISEKEAEKTLSEYKKRGWFDMMKNDLKAEGIDPRHFSSHKDSKSIFNIKFKPEDSDIYSKPVLIDTPELIKSTRYNLFHHNPDNIKPIIDDFESEYDFKTGNLDPHPLKKKSVKRSRKREKELILKHNEVSEKFHKYLKEEYKDNETRSECRAYGKSRIDLVRRTNKGDVFYEIKTFVDPLSSIRYALGQLFEYAFYPNTENSIKLCIVSHVLPNGKAKKYIKKVNEIVSIPVEYICFDPQKNEIIETI